MAYSRISVSPHQLDENVELRTLERGTASHLGPFPAHTEYFQPKMLESSRLSSQAEVSSDSARLGLLGESRDTPLDIARTSSRSDSEEDKKHTVIDTISKPFKHTQKATRRCFGNQSWRFGLLAGLYASIAVLLSNLILFIYGSTAHGGITDGIGTISKGDSQSIERLSTAYHVLINILSTILLTSSNYAMQLLCAPTREEIDDAHTKGSWLDIGQVSLHNLVRIKRGRMVLWIILALSSAPLHLFFNSSVFELVMGQDYQVTVIQNGTSSHDYTGWRKLENKDWKDSYSTQWVSDYGDLHLIVDQIAFSMQLNETLGFELDTFAYNSTADDPGPFCNWTSWPTHQTEYHYPVTVDFSSSTLKLQAVPADIRLEYPLSDPNNPPFPDYSLPTYPLINVSETLSIMDQIGLCPNKDWLLATPLHVGYAMAEIIPDSSKVQIALPFLLIVIAANIAKVVAIFLTLRTCSPTHIITVGDAVSSFLQRPEKRLKVKSTLEKVSYWSDMEGWVFHKMPAVALLGGRWLGTGMILTVAVSLVIASNAWTTVNTPQFTAWGTASDLLVPGTWTSFDTSGLLKVILLANLPQMLLSLVYFAINRVCTSVHFATEWNSFATKRKGLRVTRPLGLQRSTHFLQLPYRWAIPLTATSGVLHWLLSQALFLVRIETRDRNGNRAPTSICACGYSPLSFLVFFCVFFTLIGAVIFLVLRLVEIRIPPARHRSNIISAACHPPLDDVDPHLKEVQWGVVEKSGEQSIGHCTFTSQEVTTPQEGAFYV